MSKFIVVALAALSLTACGAKGERLEKMVRTRVDRALEEVDATAPQKERVQQLEKQLLTDAKPVVEQGLATRQSLIEQWKSSTVDSARVHALLDAQFDSARGFAHKAADAAIELHNLLTPEQREKLSAQAAERQAHHHRRSR